MGKLHMCPTDQTTSYPSIQSRKEIRIRACPRKSTRRKERKKMGDKIGRVQDSDNRPHDQERRAIFGKVDRLGTGEKPKANSRGKS